LKIFNIYEDFPALIMLDPNNFRTIELPIDQNFAPPLTFKTVRDRSELFLHSNFTIGDFHYVCEVGESYHILSKMYLINEIRFDIWLSEDEKRLFSSEIELFILELTLQA
jgi:hypothetical protein